jgi:hypothetical protein
MEDDLEFVKNGTLLYASKGNLDQFKINILNI